MLDILITLLIYCAILGVVWWIISVIPFPPPFQIIVKVVFGLTALFMLLSLVGVLPGMRHHWRL